MITTGNLIAYQYAVHNGYSEEITRSMVFTVLIISNIASMVSIQEYSHDSFKIENSAAQLLQGLERHDEKIDINYLQH